MGFLLFNPIQNQCCSCSSDSLWDTSASPPSPSSSHHRRSPGQMCTPTRRLRGGPAGQSAPPRSCRGSAGWLRVSGRRGGPAASLASSPAGRNETPAHARRRSMKPGVQTRVSWVNSVNNVLRPLFKHQPHSVAVLCHFCSPHVEAVIVMIGRPMVSSTDLVAVAQVAVALPAAGTGAAEARGGLRGRKGRGLGAHRRALVLPADEFRLR